MAFSASVMPFSCASAFHIRFQLRQLRLQQVGRAAGHRVGAVEHPRLQGGVHRGRGAAVLAFQDTGGLLRDGFVALAAQHVEHRPGADNLRGRGHQRDEAEVLAHAGDFRQYFIQTVGGALLLQLAFKVGEHPARHRATRIRLSVPFSWPSKAWYFLRTSRK